MQYKCNNKIYTKMELATKTQQISFREWYNSLDSLGKIKFRDQFMNISGIKYPTFYSKLQRNFFSLLEKKAIQELVGDQYKIIF